MTEDAMKQTLLDAGATFDEVRGVRMPVDFGDVVAEYEAASRAAVICVRPERGVIDVTGADRAAWLNNLVTNTIRELSPGEGNYAFVLNVKGRILLDVNMLVREDAIRLDVDLRGIEKAMTHLDRYVIMEQVSLKDRSAEFVRFGVLGPMAMQVCTALGASHAATMASLGSTMVTVGGKPRLMVRHDFAGTFGVELYIEAADAVACWNELMQQGQSVSLQPVGHRVLDTLRIEAGIPVYGQEIDDTVLPAETGQFDRSVSFVKGCYLGQEVVERMRSRGSLARRLVGLTFRDATDVPPGATLQAAGADVGRVTSSCHSPAVRTTIALGYIKTAIAAPGTEVTLAGAPAAVATVVELPFPREAA